MNGKVVRRGLTLGLALLLAALAAPRARAQGMFLQEVVKDGRIYVFNDAKRAQAFEKSGEMGTGITRLGAGPNGETVIADSEQALDLFFFKHGIPQAVERPAPPVQKIEWRDGKTRFTLGKNFHLEMSNRLQPRFTYEMPDGNVTLGGTENAGDGKSSFRIRRAKFKLEGWFYKPELEFELQLNWPDASTTQPNRFLEDANVDWDISKKKTFRVRFGQFKAPYGRQQLASSGAQQFVDRAITDERYNPGRETGVALWGTLGSNKLDWRVMASNGNGRTQSANDNSKFLLSGRLQYQLVGNTRMDQWGSGLLLTEGDLGDSATGALLAIGANFLSNDRSFVSATATNNNDTQYGGDYIFKYRNFSSLGEYHNRQTKPQNGATGLVGSQFKDQGYLLQASYAFKTNRLGLGSFVEIASRYAWIDPTDAVASNTRTEVGGAVSYYYNKHNLKVQADYRQVKDEAKRVGERKANEFRLQTQFVF